VKGGANGVSLQQPETEVDDSCHSWRVPSKWKGTQKGSEKGTSKGREKQGELQGELRHVYM
jgi:hypothetical protein